MQHPKDVKGSDKSLLSIPVGQRYTTILDRLDNIEAEIRVLQYSAGKMNEWLSRAEHRVNELQEKIDAID
jgi:hypothetical protein